MIQRKDPNTGEILGQYDSGRDAARKLGFSRSWINESIKLGTPSYGSLWEKVESVVDKDIDTYTDTTTKGYEPESNMPSAWSPELNRYYTIEEYCKLYGLDYNTVKSSKLVAHNQKHMIYNIAFYTPEEESIVDIFNGIDDIVKKYIKPVSCEILGIFNNSYYFDRLVYTDVHIGMGVNGDGDPLYDGKWDREEVMIRANKMIEWCFSNQLSDELIIDDLGDLMDGLGGLTARGQHQLPQTMNDKEAFDLALEFKMYLLEGLLQNYTTITCHNITNDNHGGIFSYFVNKAFKEIAEAKYTERVMVENIKRFIDHYSVYNHTFILSHGKDASNLKFGFKKNLDPQQIEKIDQYCKQHGLYNGNTIEFSKGDLHQGVFDDTTSNDFAYYNYPAFSPPSDWVKTNYKNSKSGFFFYNISKDSKDKHVHPYYF